MLIYVISGNLELFGGRQCFVSPIRAGASHKREARVDVQDFETPYQIRAEIAATGRVHAVQLYYWICYVLRAHSARGGSEINWDSVVNPVDGKMPSFNHPFYKLY